MNEWRMKDYDEWMKDERLWWMNKKWLVVKNTLRQVSEGKIDYFILSVNCVFFRKWFVSVRCQILSEGITHTNKKKTKKT